VSDSHPRVHDFATDFDHTDQAWVADPYPIWNDLRQRCPVAHSDRYGGAWLPVTHDLVSEVAYDTEHFTSRSVVVSERRPGPEDLPAPIGVAPPISSDPPYHGLVRRMLLPAFTPKPIAALEPFTRELCRELLAATDGRASFDAAVEYAQHIPVRVIVRFLGFPQEDADLFRDFIHPPRSGRRGSPPSMRTWTRRSKTTLPGPETTSPRSSSPPRSTGTSCRWSTSAAR
jgi:hypothetical protein